MYETIVRKMVASLLAVHPWPWQLKVSWGRSIEDASGCEIADNLEAKEADQLLRIGAEIAPTITVGIYNTGTGEFARIH